MFQKGDIVQFSSYSQPSLSLVTNISDRSFGRFWHARATTDKEMRLSLSVLSCTDLFL